MENKNLLTKILAIVGTVLVWLPIAAPLLLGLASLVTRHRFLLDYLMPAELFLLVLVGGGLLLWAALRRRKYRGLIGWGLGSSLVLLAGCQGLAVVTGLASGDIQPGGWQSAVVTAALIGYILAVVVTGIGGALLVRDVYLPSTK